MTAQVGKTSSGAAQQHQQHQQQQQREVETQERHAKASASVCVFHLSPSPLLHTFHSLSSPGPSSCYAYPG